MVSGTDALRPPGSSTLQHAIAAALRELPAVNRLLVGFSGGMDSAVLLHALAATPGESTPAILAVHVHHGIQRAADPWPSRCETFCDELEVPFTTRRVEARAQRGESPEAAARRARYDGFLDLMEPGDCLLTAHHREDQAETVLLRLLRGAGVRGLGGMARTRRLGPGWHARPLLDVPRRELKSYARTHGLPWIEDPSNRDLGFDRNYLRHAILPRLRDRWEGCTATLARSAQHMGDAAELLDALAELDHRACTGSRRDTLSASSLTRLSPSRRRNLLRYWLQVRGHLAPPAEQLHEITRSVIRARWDACPQVTWCGAIVRRYRDDLYVCRPMGPHDPTRVIEWPDPARPLSLGLGGQTIEARSLEALGMDPGSLEAPVTIRFRRGGERCRVQGRVHHQSLKSLFQQAGVPPWERNRIPLVYSGERLMAVLGYWACDCAARRGH